MINFQNTDLYQVVQIYSDLVDRTVIRPTTLPATTDQAVHGYPLTRSETIYSLTATFALNGISVMPAGEKFVFVFPDAQKDMATEILARKPAAIAAGTNSIPAGSINLMSAALPWWPGYTGKYPARAGTECRTCPTSGSFSRSQTALTPDEALQGLNTRWAGIIW